MKKSYAVLGIGRFGGAVARELFRLGNDVLAVDNCDEHVQEIADHVTRAVAADVRDENVLRTLGIGSFDCVIVGMTDVESSAMTVLALQELGVENIVCKAKNRMHAALLEKLGADRIIQPELEMGQRLAQKLASSNVLDYIEVGGKQRIVELAVPGSWAGKTLRDLNVRQKYSVFILAVRPDGGSDTQAMPAADYALGEKDILVVMGEVTALEKVQNL